MKQLIISLVCIAISLAAYAKPQCQGFNNYNDKVTIVFTDKDADKTYSVSDAKLVTLGKEYAATSVQANVKNGVATVTLTFPHITKFSNPKVTLRINGKKANFKVCQ
ncbi:hypothetical protein [Bacteroides acidifaciens]|jgi:hypothetical protein|uniref:hypothetical protein n=1 Tax=Bacteroides acidifaciens TaxID=85831 RepID=UPI0026283362|nr:hypothetical protein [Bacteroides acidifaciens]